MIDFRRRAFAPLALALSVALLGAACTNDEGEESKEATKSGQSAVEFKFRALDAGGPNTKAALEKGDIDIALLFSSDGAIVANDWVALEDDKKLQPADNFVPAIRTDKVTPEITAVLDAVNEKLTVDVVREAVKQVSIDGENPGDAAQAILDENDLPGDLKATGSLTVGSSNFPESSIAAELYGRALKAAGVSITNKADIGARDVYFAALTSGEIDLVPEFSGTLLTFLDPEATPSADSAETYDASKAAAAEKKVTLTAPAEADSVNTFVVTKDTADKYELATVSDLAGVEDELTLGGPPECPERPLCLAGLEKTYKLRFAG